MSLLAASVGAALVGVGIVLFLVVRFAMKMMWKLAMLAVLVLLALVVAGGAYAYLHGVPVPGLPAITPP